MSYMLCSEYYMGGFYGIIDNFDQGRWEQWKTGLWPNLYNVDARRKLDIY